MALARAAVLELPGKIELRSFAIPDPEPGYTGNQPALENSHI